MNFIQPSKRNQVVVHATMWVNLKNIMLREGRQTQSTTNCRIPFICTILKGKSREIENRLVAARSWGKGKSGRNCLTGKGVSLEVMKMFWNWM